MPELAEVFYYAGQWSAGKGKKVRRVELHDRVRVFRGCDVEALEEGLAGTRLKDGHTHGKQMLFEFTGGHWLWVHLGMTGHLSAPRQPYEATKHDHLVLHQLEHALVFTDFRQFGGVRYYREKRMPAFWRNLPPQPHEKGFTVAVLAEALNRRPKMPVKALLLDQAVFPGIGNWMADEILWQAKMLPQTEAGEVNKEKTRVLHRSVRKVAEVSLATVGKKLGDPPANWLFHHRWSKGQACPRCQEPLLRGTLVGRTACWCPQCQH